MGKQFGFFLLIFLNLSINNAIAWQNDKTALKRLKAEADELFNNHQYSEALHYYLALQNQDVDQGLNNYKIALCYLGTDQKQNAFDYLIAAKKCKHINYVIHYYLGRVYHEAGHFTQALYHFNVYLEKLNKDKVIFRPYTQVPAAHLIHYQKSPRDIQRFIVQCTMALRNSE